MSDPATMNDLTPNEREAVRLLRWLKTHAAAEGNGHLHIEVRQGLEVLFEPTPRQLPPQRPAKARC